jgi:molybdopterin-containing oxidoreductase family iron-sulfur binding subunit
MSSVPHEPGRPGPAAAAGADGAPTYWQSLGTRQGGPEVGARLAPEVVPGADEPPGDEVTRRTFLGLMGASLALAGTTGCSVMRKPAQYLLPHAKRPEDLIPGEPVYYATAWSLGGATLGLLVETHDGRPTKVEGNPKHPMSGGRSGTWAQAAILDLYDPNRAHGPTRGGTTVTAADVDAALAEVGAAARQGGGQGLAVVVDATPSPTLLRLLAELRAAAPAARLYVHDHADTPNARAGLAAVGISGHAVLPALRNADVVLALDADVLGVEGDMTLSAADLAARRRAAADDAGVAPPRLYVVEPGFSTTGAMADNRLRLQASRVHGFLAAVAARLFASGLPVPPGAEGFAAGLGAQASGPEAWVQAVADDLRAHAGRAVVLVGERQGASTHALAHLVNAALGAPGSTLLYRPVARHPDGAGTLAELAAALESGSVETLVLIGVNAAYDAPADLDFPAKLRKAKTSVHVGATFDETGGACTWHVPLAHVFEAWGDLESADGTLAVQQPLIEPLFGALSCIEALARLGGTAGAKGHDLVRATMRAQAVPGASDADFERSWRAWLSDGVVRGPVPPVTPAFTWPQASLAAPVPGDGLEIDFVLSGSVHDGRFASNAWLQELPDPMTKVTWENAACLSPPTASRLGLPRPDEDGKGLQTELVSVRVGDRAIELPIVVSPGLADDVVVVALGGGRRAAGPVGTDRGADANRLRTVAAPWFAHGVTLSLLGRRTTLGCTQLHGSLVEPRTGRVRDSLVRESTVDAHRADPGRFAAMELMPAEKIKSLWVEPNERGGQQWGMAIDLNACVGCNACTIACQAENNIPVVGKEQVVNGREMHWIRLDRYYTGSEEDPESVIQPIPCMQCENAPCEQVCPVAATAHSPEGLNDMAYNRCIGTRYCSNNCPYKVRRFNFFNFAKENEDAYRPAPVSGKQAFLDEVMQRNVPFTLIALQRNPDVSVRFRGVMEKCTYCVQRINTARIDARAHGDGVVPDGAVTPACAQACPADAIVFGDVNDPASRVSRTRTSSRNYAMLAELNTRPRTTYLARLRNPNPALG